MNAALLRRLEVEDFLYREAALLDDWKLKDWLALFAPLLADAEGLEVRGSHVGLGVNVEVYRHLAEVLVRR